MLISNEIKEMRDGGSLPVRINVRDSVLVRSTGQIGTVVGFDGSRLKIRLTEGGEITVDRGNLEKRQTLMG